MPLLDGKDSRSVREAAERLAAGELVAFPTETVYGLGARADDDAAVAGIFAAKGRPADHPLIVHTADAAGALHFAAAWPQLAQVLAEAFWPGPLTLIVQRARGVAAAAAGGHATLGLRVPSHPIAQALLRASRGLGVRGIAAPSANRFRRVSPTSAAHVVDEFDKNLCVLDGGDCSVGIESTIVDCSREHPVLLRPGMLQRAELEAVLRQSLRRADPQSPRASGTLAVHYAPSAKVQLMTAPQLRAALLALEETAGSAGLVVYSRSVGREARRVEHRQMPESAAAVAHELFSVLREFDERGARLILIERPPESADWDGVRDRLQRAAAVVEGTSA